jgi:hypothetical protein
VNGRAERIGRNEALYRSVNERIEGLNEAFGTLTDTMTVVCECGDGACAQQIDVSVRDYERTRSDPTHFIVVPGHEILDAEHVIERHDAFIVVQKNEGGPAELARELDPRS